MQHSAAPRNELTKALTAIQAMESASDLDGYEDAWKSYLHALERSFNKATAHYSRSPKWHAWWGTYKRDRGSDPLLSYLINARGADEHTVEDITRRSNGGIGINPAKGNDLYIEDLSIINGKITIRSPQPIRVDFLPGKMVLLPVTNRGRVYAVPTHHLGESVNPEDVASVARLGHGYYSKFLDAAEAYFVR